ncbi:hypothetical protein Cgig2_018477 [Carnegiea gigantea]|uniref:Uncharacterized protein n=1 Tax=Carnegiea gigantea TaxID=171969 RepID=A0A9Q1JMJ6_9CARY|nr:hypothetical protein Cgig2_018477 [Carnegiea gigantea]
MASNKDWMNLKDHLSEEYKKGVESFLNYTFTKLGIESIRFLQMVQQCSTTDNAATITSVMATTRHLQQVQERPQGNGNYHGKTRKTPIVDAIELMTSNSFQVKRQISIKMTSSDLGNRLGNKSSMPRSDRQMFVAPSMLAGGCGRKLQELYASKSHNTSFLERGTNNKIYVKSYATIDKSIDGSLMRHSSIRANSGDGDPFSPMRYFSSSRNPSCPPLALVHEDDVSNDGFKADNNDNENASFSENDAISTSEDENFHNPQSAYNFNHALGESELVTEIAQTVFSNDDMEVYREHVLEHMHALWTNWRADLKRYNITKPGRTLRQALDHVPSGLVKYEWE